MEKRGWFAEQDPDNPVDKYQWRPVLQADGWVGELDGIWFATEAECIDWIKRQVLAHGLYDD